MSPLAGWPVIPPQFEAHHRPVVAQTFTALCTVHRLTSTPPPYPLPEDWTGRTLLWTGMCRLQELQREADPVVGEQPTQTRRYLLALPFENGQGEALPQLRTGERGDIAVVGARSFNLLQSMAGSILWENDFISQENQTQQNP